jgi:hypothetical protein
VVVTAEIKDAQTAKGAFGSGALAYSVGGADATHAASTTASKAPKSVKQISSKGPKFAAIEKIGQDLECPLPRIVNSRSRNLQVDSIQAKTTLTNRNSMV